MKKDAFVRRLCLVGSTGLVGLGAVERAIGRRDIRIIGITRREVRLPKDARMEMLLADPSGWPEAIAAANAHVLVCALGTTMRRVEGSEEAFRAVDHDLVVSCAKAARAAGIEHMILVSSVGADPASRNFYLRVKGETEVALGWLGFKRLDILRPGLLVGPRKESRPLERIAMWLSPLLNLFLHGKYRKFRSVRVRMLADAIFALAHERARGRFVHEYEAMQYAVRRAGD